MFQRTSSAVTELNSIEHQKFFALYRRNLSTVVDDDLEERRLPVTNRWQAPIVSLILRKDQRPHVQLVTSGIDRFTQLVFEQMTTQEHEFDVMSPLVSDQPIYSPHSCHRCGHVDLTMCGRQRRWPTSLSWFQAS